ncbi:MAG: response regulator, partial [Candidatus Rokubacteria bacterium]|nr:response regulator [Candidatus Rokubacteria bacterium]
MPLDQLEAARGVRPVILVVDDDPGLRESFRAILEDEYEVLDVPDGLQALDIVRSCQVDLVLL